MQVYSALEFRSADADFENSNDPKRDSVYEQYPCVRKNNGSTLWEQRKQKILPEKILQYAGLFFSMEKNICVKVKRIDPTDVN